MTCFRVALNSDDISLHVAKPSRLAAGHGGADGSIVKSVSVGHSLPRHI